MASQIYDKIANNAYFVRQPNLTYRLGETESSGKISGLDSVKQAVYHILMTERYSNPIYDEDYGVELNQYVNKDLGYISATIEDTLKDALLQDDRITDVVVTNITQSTVQPNACLIEFTVMSIYGQFEGKVDVIQ